MYVMIVLSDDEKRLLDDGQEWYDQNNEVTLGGWLPDGKNQNPAFSLGVNGYEHDNWIHWGDMPEWLRERFPVAKES